MKNRAVVIGVFLVALLAVAARATAWFEPPPEPIDVDVDAPAPVPLPPGTLTVEVPIERGATFGGILGDRGVPTRAVREAALEHYDLAKIRPDRELFLVYTEGEAEPSAVRYVIDEDNTVIVERSGEEWSARLDVVEYDVEVGTRDLTLTRSLWEDGLEAGLRPIDLVRLAKIFEYDIDFNTELREGAGFSLVADIQTAVGRRPRLGDIHAVRIANDGKEITAIRHLKSDDTEAYYHPDGTGMKRPFLRSPLEFSKVTSGFNPKRFHPILKKARPHNGTDFGAPSGTSVRAVGSGKVVHAGRNGGHGLFVKIDHEGPYETSYSHLSRVMVKTGQTIKQGELIGQVGSTGLSTGPHLHFQMWKNGKYVDAMRIELPTSTPLESAEKAAFATSVDKWLALLPGTADEPVEADVE